MSSICGLVWRDGREVSSVEVDRMVDRLGHWGPDATGVWREGAAGLGNCALWSTLEAKTERLPFRDHEMRVVITADARIDNREDLLRELGLVAAARGVIGDGELIVRAYAKWGMECAEHLVGDYAFALWDERARRLFCARDPMGIKPFFYHADGRRLLFGSEAKAIFTDPEVSRELNPMQIGVSLAGLPTFDDQTAFKAVRTLEPASTLCLDERGLRIWKYWRLDPRREIRFARDEDYVEAFEEILQRSVDARLRSAGRVGCMLSGGLDATTCLALAMRGGKAPAGELSAFSWALREGDDWWEPDERPFIDAFLKENPLDHHYVINEPARVFDLSPEVRSHQNGPVARIDHCQMTQTFEAARARGVRALLNGTGGDETASYAAPDHLLAHLLRGDFGALSAEVDVRAAKSGAAKWRQWTRLLRAVIKKERMPTPLNYQWTYRRRCERMANLAELGIPLSQSLVDRVGLVSHVKERSMPRIAEAWPRPMRADQIYILTQTHVMSDQVAEWRYAASYGIECRCPYLDRRVIEYAVAMPPRQHAYGAVTRRLLRRVAMRHLPEKISGRLGKTSTMPDLGRGLVQGEAEYLRRIKGWRGDSRITAFVDLDRLEADLRWVVEKTNARSVDWVPGFPFCRGFMLAMFLESAG